jgi:PAS domain S-box-containing protein
MTERLALSRDVTADARWRSIFENGLDAMLLTAPDGSILAANPAACALLGRSEREICTVGRVGVAVANDAAVRFLAERERDGKACGVLTLRRKDGTTFLAEVSSAIFADANGAPRTSMTFRDVTERERSHQALEILADAGRVLANSLDIQATLTNLTNLVVPRLADVCTVDLFEGDEVNRVAVAHRDPSRVKDFIQVRRPMVRNDTLGGVDRVLRTGEPSSIFNVTDEWLRNVAHDEEHFLAARALGIRSFVATPLVAHDRTIGALTFMSDGGVPAFTEADLPLVQAMAERAALAIDNAHRHAEVVEARQLRDEVLGIVSHDLRNPLSAIRINATILGRSQPSRHVDAINTAVDRADRLLQDLMMAAKTEAGGLVLERRLEDVDSILEEVSSLHRTLADSRAITLIVAIDGHVPRAKVDRHRIVQALSNLLANAIKFTPPGGRVELRARGEANGVVLSVSDTGTGIAKEHLPHVFDRFWQGAQAREAGAGLGLTIARGIAEAHGGTIFVESRVGSGTTFTFVLPGPSGLQSAALR